MPDQRLARLLLISRGCRAYDPDRWVAVEQEIGLAFSGSYKAIVKAFGVSYGAISCYLRSPFSREASLQGLRSQDARRGPDRSPQHLPRTTRFPSTRKRGPLFSVAAQTTAISCIPSPPARPNDFGQL